MNHKKLLNKENLLNKDKELTKTEKALTKKWLTPIKKCQGLDYKQCYITRIKNKFLLSDSKNIIFLEAKKTIRGYFNIYTSIGTVIGKIIKNMNNFYIKSKIGPEITILFGKKKTYLTLPRKVYIAIPNSKLNKEHEKRILRELENIYKYSSNITFGTNKKPKKINNGYVLDMINANIPSSKNMQILINGNMVYEFGRISDDKFSVLFIEPLSILQAFGLALTSF